MLGSSGQTRRDSNKQAEKKASEQRAPKALKRKRGSQSLFGERLKARKVTGESCQSEASSKSGFNSIAISVNNADDENTASQSQTDLNA